MVNLHELTRVSRLRSANKQHGIYLEQACKPCNSQKRKYVSLFAAKCHAKEGCFGRHECLYTLHVGRWVHLRLAICNHTYTDTGTNCFIM